ncbi:MAG: hypothetical protein ACRD7E_16855 [Bryobacteraceae bacterium]
MSEKTYLRSITRGIAAGVGLASASYASYAAVTWARYGRPRRSKAEQESTLDRFMAAYEVVERHEVRVAAPCPVTFLAACEMDFEDSLVIRSIFKARELILGGEATNTVQGRGLVPQMTELGWRILAEVPGHEIVMGAVTQPWAANPIFRSLSPDEFLSFHEPGYVKIAWNLRADPAGAGESVFTTETRALATDATARAKFRLYWSFASPGIWLIRRLMLGHLKREAERRFRAALPQMPDTAASVPELLP